MSTVRHVPAVLGAAAVLMTMAQPAEARPEPYLAVRTGLHCGHCHTNRTGGGGRNEFGSIYAQSRLPSRPSSFRGRSLNTFLSAGGNLRILASGMPAEATPRAAVEVDEANVQLEARLVSDVLTLYVDETLGPGGAATREVFALVESLPLGAYLKAGKFLLPYGLRLPDDGEFIRQRTGFTYDTPDQGIELGFDPGRLSGSVAFTNGSAGGPERDDGKQITGSLAVVFRSFRLGASATRNQTENGRREAVGVFGGVGTGRLALLGELDGIRDTPPRGAALRQLAGYVEGDLLLTRGVNLKATYGFLDPDASIGENARVRARFGLETFPLAFLQLSAFYTLLQDIPQARSDLDRIGLELHAHF